MNILGALGYGLINLFHPRMLWLMVWPMLAALAFWGAVALLLWIKVALWLAGVLRNWLEPALGFVRLDFGDATLVAAHVILFLLFVPVVYLTGLFILGVFGMPRMVEHAAAAGTHAVELREGTDVAVLFDCVSTDALALQMAARWKEARAAVPGCADVEPRSRRHEGGRGCRQASCEGRGSGPATALGAATAALLLFAAPAVFAGTTTVFFTAINASKWVPYAWLGLIDGTNMLAAVALAPFAMLGVWLGVKLLRRLPAVWFYRLVSGGLLITGLKLTWDGLR